MPRFADMTLKQFLAEAASGAPVPGGGGVAALAGALGAAMASMAANFTVGKPKYAEHDELMRRTLDALAPLRDALLKAVDDDADAFSGISAAYALPRAGDAEKAARKAAIAEALAKSMRAPLRVARFCGEAARLLPPLAGAGNANLLSDVEVAAVMLEAGVLAARINVLINTSQLDTGEAGKAEDEANALVDSVRALARETVAAIAARRAKA